MKILQLIQKPQLRGVEVFTCQLSNHLLESGHEVKILCLLEGDARLPFNGSILELKRPISKRFFDLEGWRQIAREIESFVPDIVQANAGDTLKYAVLSKLIFRWKSKIVFRNASKMGDFINTKAKHLLNSFFLKQVHHVISVSELCRLDFIRTFQYPIDQIDTVTIGIEEEPVGDIPADLRPVFDNHPVFVNIAGLVPEKNQKGLLSIFKLLKDVVPDAQLLIIGRGRFKPELEAYASQLAIHESVHFLDYRQDVLEILKASKALLLPSNIEGLPGVILEGQYCRTPIIAYNVGGVSEVVEHRKTGWLIEKDDENSFLKAMIEVLESPEHIVDRITEHAYQQVTRHYDNREIARKFTEVYSKICRSEIPVVRGN